MGNTSITVVTIFLSLIVMFILPFMTFTKRTNDVSFLAAQTATTQYVDDTINTGVMTLEDYDAFYEKLAADGNSYKVDVLIQQLDENPGMKTTQVESNKNGENQYYYVYTTQFENELKTKGIVYLGEGYILTVTVRIANPTLEQRTRNFFYMILGNDSNQIVAQSSGMVTVNGNSNKN